MVASLAVMRDAVRSVAPRANLGRMRAAGVKSALLLTSRKPSRACRSLVPEGHLTIAQQFIAGNLVLLNKSSPVGMDEGPARFICPYGTRLQYAGVIPAMNRRAILTCPYGASLEMWVIARLEGRAEHREGGEITHGHLGTPWRRTNLCTKAKGDTMKKTGTVPAAVGLPGGTLSRACRLPGKPLPQAARLLGGTLLPAARRAYGRSPPCGKAAVREAFCTGRLPQFP